MVRNIKLLLKVIPLLFISSCWMNDYSGDGHFIDNGFYSTQRYVLDFGEINLKQTGTHTFNLEDLPNEVFTFGIEVTPKSMSKFDESNINANVVIRVIDDQGEVLINPKSNLLNWTWSKRVGGDATEIFGYVRRGRDNENNINENGTYLDASKHSQYTLKLDILKPDTSNENYSVRLLTKGGGWK